jgi:hypothetical protein
MRPISWWWGVVAVLALVGVAVWGEVCYRTTARTDADVPLVRPARHHTSRPVHPQPSRAPAPGLSVG